MRTTLIGMSLAVALAGAALADGYEDPKSFSAPPPPIWSGWYVGAGVGYGHASTKDDYSEERFSGTFTSTLDGQSAQGGLVRFMLGVDRQIKEKFVLGVFADIDWTDINQSFTQSQGGAGGGADRRRTDVGVAVGRRGARRLFVHAADDAVFSRRLYAGTLQ